MSASDETPRPGDTMAELRQAMRDAEALNAAAGEALETASRAVKTLIETPLNAAKSRELLSDSPPPCAHRRQHRPGRPGKIASDPELQAFIRARADRLTYDQLAEAIAKAFPPARHVSRSTIHKWWTAETTHPKTPR